MTNRLKLLTTGLVLSLIFAVNDYYQMSKKRPKPRVTTRKAKPSVQKIRKKSNINRQKRVIEEAAKSNLSAMETHGEFLEIPEEILQMNQWNRNPFIQKKVLKLGSEPEIISNRNLKSEQPRMADFELLKIESVAKLDEKVYVIINGNRYEEGDRIDRYIIEDIYDDRVVFLLGDTRVLKGVGK